MNSKRPTPRLLQQQPERRMDRAQQQMSGSGDFQPRGATGSADRPAQMGEGSYEGTRDYQKRMRNYLDKADVKADAQAARPSSRAEAEELRRAEDEGRSHTRAPGK